MKSIYLVRHGQTQLNLEQKYSGQLEVPLSPLGVAAVERLGTYLEDVPFQAAYVSDLHRARQTLALILKDRQVPVKVDSLLREASFGAWEGLTFAQVSHNYPDCTRKWMEDAVTVAPPGGESLLQMSKRVMEMWQEIITREEDNILVVTHGGPIQVMLCQVLGMPLKNFWKVGIGNSGLAVVSCAGSHCSLTYLNSNF